MAKFQKGNKHGKGRPKGYSPKQALVKRAEEIMANKKFNPTEFLIDLAKDKDTSREVKARIGIQLHNLINPKPGAGGPPKDPEEDPEDDDDDDLPDDEEALQNMVGR